MTVIDRLCKRHVGYLKFYQSFTFIRVCYCCIVLSAISQHTTLLVAYVVSRRVASHSVFSSFTATFVHTATNNTETYSLPTHTTTHSRQNEER